MSDEHLAVAVDTLLAELLGSEAELGLQVAVIQHGQILVDAACGVADPRTAAPVDPGTLFWAGSTAKGVATSVAHVLVERGELTYDIPIVEVWPEFGAQGKDRVTLRQVLLHTAGVPGLPPDTTAADLCDWDRMCAVIADAEPWWEPGTRFGYHAKTFGFLLGEVLRDDLGPAARARHRPARCRRRGYFHHEAGEAMVFCVAPTKILAFGKGAFSHTRHRF